MEKDKQTPREELKELSPLLERLKPLRRVPEHESYFDQMQSEVLERIKQGEGSDDRRRKGVRQLTAYRYKIATVAAAAVGAEAVGEEEEVVVVVVVTVVVVSVIVAAAAAVVISAAVVV